MPSRVIREGLLDSQRYWSVSIEARQLFVHLLLLADDFGLVSLAPVFLRRRCFDNPAPADAKIGKQLAELQDADLVRIYEAGDGAARARYGFVPRFGQRLRMMRCKHPMPPDELYSDDAEAKIKFTENSALFEKMPAARRQHADNLRPEVEVEVEGNRREGEVKQRGKGKSEGEGEITAGVTGTRTGLQTGLQTETQTPAQQEKPNHDLMNWAAANGLQREPAESEFEFKRRATAAYSKSLGVAA